MRRLFTLCVLMLLNFQLAKAQDPSFSQPYSAPIYLNPAFAGNVDGVRASLSHRKQWHYVPGTFRAVQASIDWREPCINSGFGFKMLSDREGEGYLNTTSFGMVYAYGVSLNKNSYLSFAMSAGIISKSIDWTKLEFSDQFDPVLGKVRTSAATGAPTLSKTFSDYDFGVVLKDARNIGGYDILSNIGLSVHHLSRPDESLLGLQTRLPRRYTVHAGAMLPTRDFTPTRGAYMFPHFTYSYQGGLTEFMGGIYGFRTPFLLGIGYRNAETPVHLKNTNSLIFHAAYQAPFNKQSMSYQLAYSYDVNLSGLSFSTYGSHEISFLIVFDGASLFCAGNGGANFGGGSAESKCIRGAKRGYLPQF